MTKQILTFPQIAIHRARGVEGNYDDFVTFFRYFPWGRINNDKTVSIRSNGRPVRFFFGDLPPITAGLFYSREYDALAVKGKVVVDIGAAYGDSAILFAFNGAAKVYGYELNKRHFDLAQKNIELNHLQDIVEIEYCGIANKKVSSADTILEACIPEQDRKSVDGAAFKTLDFVVKERAIKDGVLKIDVDGFEYEILRNVEPETLRNFESIFLEYHFGVQDLESKLKAAGFSVEKKEVASVSIPHHPAEFREMEIGYLLAKRIT